MMDMGNIMYSWARDLFPYNRSITGEDNRITLRYLKGILPGLQIKHFRSGEKVFDWQVPEEWSVSEAYIEDEDGKRIIDFKENNLHLISYSVPVDEWLGLEELKLHLHSLPEQPDAIPYITSYYKKRWGFCITHEQLSNLKDSRYHVVIRSAFFDGEMNYGELIIPGASDEEVLLSTYICHPSMGNNELSGIVVTTAISQWLMSLPTPRYTYRIIFIPETIGSIAYLSRHYREMKQKTKVGFVITCVGDNNRYSFMPSRTGNTYADRLATYAMNYLGIDFEKYSFLDRGSDERQYCSPLINLPVVSIMRSKYGTFPEYHTSLDNLDFISPEGLQGAYDAIRTALAINEKNLVYEPLIPCEPQLGKRGLYNITSNQSPDSLINILAYVDGCLDLMDLSEIIKADFFECHETCAMLVRNGLISVKVNG